ncbi:hypothetical protein SDC9_208713 [bioreactor metagenome]|uniref:Uncharacterized protein n=1 Tax=bioreactor metagenome TaxID=1076179 RepID=A0A645JE79_9ZZZZ
MIFGRFAAVFESVRSVSDSADSKQASRCAQFRSGPQLEPETEIPSPAGVSAAGKKSLKLSAYRLKRSPTCLRLLMQLIERARSRA